MCIAAFVFIALYVLYCLAGGSLLGCVLVVLRMLRALLSLHSSPKPFTALRNHLSQTILISSKPFLYKLLATLVAVPLMH
jgi:hypothetical protein